jgi:protein-S-isoprenylcysteine O-methyltransferase Ste14
MSTHATNAEGCPDQSPERRMTASWLPFKVGYLLSALACLIQWGKPSIWLRIDIFSGGYLLMRALPVLWEMVLRDILSQAKASAAVEWRRERWGSNAAPGWVSWALVLMVADLAVFLDYGHWHLLPGLEQPIAQALGLLLHVAAALWKRWTDRYLGAAFAKSVRPMLMQSGPFRYIRHPFYAGALLDKVAVALVFASIVGWLLVIPWAVLLLRQVWLEELHLRRLFGQEYETYARQTARLLPGVF